MPAYAKVYGSIFTGSLRGHSDEILVFINLLVHADRNGISNVHTSVIEDDTGLSPSRVKKAICVLSSPDPESTHRNNDGRRIELLDPNKPWGWRIVNHDFFRNLSGDDRNRENTRKRVQKYRIKQGFSDLCNVTDTRYPGSGSGSVQIGGVGERENDANGYELPITHPHVNGDKRPDPQLVIKCFQEFWNLYPRKQSMNDAQHAWVEVNATAFSDKIQIAVRQQSESKNWKEDNGRYIPAPAKWLREGRWNDAPPPPPRCF